MRSDPHRSARTIVAAAVLAIGMVVAPDAGADVPCFGAQIGSQPRMFLPGAMAAAVVTWPLGPSFDAGATLGAWFTVFDSLLHGTVRIGLSSSFEALWRPASTGLAVNVSAQVLSVADGGVTDGSLLSSVSFGPALRSSFVVARFGDGAMDDAPSNGRRRAALSIVPEAGLLWTANAAGFDPSPDPYLSVSLRLVAPRS